MSDVIRWEDPPDHGNTGSTRQRAAMFADAAKTLKASPTQWALVADGLTTGYAGSLAHRIRYGKLRAFAPARSFETRCVGAAGDTDAKVYARYIGPVTP